jgi:hypothetical protein
MNAPKLVLLSAVCGLWAFSTSAASLAPGDAASHVGETATVCGLVASAKFAANSLSQPTFLDLECSPHRGDFRKRSAEVRDAREVTTGKRICVTGIINQYRGKPEVILHDPSQLSE